MDVLRSLLSVSPLQAETERAHQTGADAVILDLEAVEPARLDEARTAARDLLPKLEHEHVQRWVRINPSHEMLAKPDIRAVMCDALTGVLVSRATSANHIRYVEALLRDAETAAGRKEGETRMIAVIESAAGLLAVGEIARSSPRLVALAFGGEEYREDLGIPRRKDTHDFQFPRGQIAIGARAAGLLAIDTPFLDGRDDVGLREDSEQALLSGFHGKVVIDPAQVATINAIFRPTLETVEYAQRIVEAHEAAVESGAMASLDGRTIDRSRVARARRVIELATAIDARDAHATI